MNLESEDTDLDSNNWPKDWESGLGYHGFSRSPANRRYFVRLTVLSAQYFIVSSTSQRKAAKLYDLALWKFAPLLVRANPNFPDEFLSITQADVDGGCSALNELYVKVAALAGNTRLPADLTERECREIALARLTQPKKSYVPVGSSPYSRYQSVLEKARAQAMLTSIKFGQARLSVDFTKLPELHAAALLAESDLNKAESSCRALQALLKSHAEFYGKMKYETD